MKIAKLLLFFLLFSGSAGHAQKWLPTSPAGDEPYRILQCTYQEAQLLKKEPVSQDSGDWSVAVDRTPIKDGITYTFLFKAKRASTNTGIAIAFDQTEWSSDNYVMIPASVYNGNRQRIVNREYATGLDESDYERKDLALTSNPIPQLSPEFGAESRLEVSICNTATPVIAYLERKKRTGVLLFTDQGIEQHGNILDHALIVEESPDRSIASFIVSVPGVREKKPEFIGFSPSPDRGISVQAGDEIRVRITRITFPCEGVPGLLDRFNRERKQHVITQAPRNLMPMNEVLARMTSNTEERYYKGTSWQYYCPENATWLSFGWVGGLINTYPMLAQGDEEYFKRVKNTFDFAISRGQASSGYFHDVIDSDGNVFYRDAAAKSSNHQDISLTRRNGDVLYWLVKQFDLLKKQGKADRIDPLWEQATRRLADAFVTTWQKHKTWGNYLNTTSGDIAVYNTTGGAMAIGGLTLAASYFDIPEYLRIAREAADTYYQSFALQGFTSGGCGDILQNADSETAAAFMTSLMSLYEATGEKAYLERSADLANLCATWTTSFPYRLPADTPLGKLNANLTGAVWASTQNKHGAPGFCTQSGDALFKLYRTTGDTLYADLLKDIIHAHTEGIQPNGKITERLTYCDADSRGSRGDGGQTGWNETNGALMALEIPGIYLRTDTSVSYVFDHVTIEEIIREKDQITLYIHNPTAYDATVRICAENQREASMLLGDNAFIQWKKTPVIQAGKTQRVRISLKKS